MRHALMNLFGKHLDPYSWLEKKGSIKNSGVNQFVFQSWLGLKILSKNGSFLFYSWRTLKHHKCTQITINTLLVAGFPTCINCTSKELCTVGGNRGVIIGKTSENVVSPKVTDTVLTPIYPSLLYIFQSMYLIKISIQQWVIMVQACYFIIGLDLVNWSLSGLDRTSNINKF